MARLKLPLLLAALLGVLILATSADTLASEPADHFMEIKVVDNLTGRPIPLVQIRTQQAGGVSFFTDSGGVAAIHLPSLEGENVSLNPFSFGYDLDKKSVEIVPGGSRTFRMDRVRGVGLAQRAYQLTGGGIYRNSQIFGDPTPLENPLINAEVLTHGPMASGMFGDELVWFFSSTGTLSTAGDGPTISGATSIRPGSGGLDPSSGVNLEYFTESTGSARNLLPALDGETVTLKNIMVPPTDPPRLFAHVDVETSSGTTQGLARWDAGNGRFRLVEEFPEGQRIKLCSNVTRIRTEGREWFYFACPLPLVRVPATPDAMADISRYQTFTPVKHEASWDGKHTERARGNDWTWKNNTPTVDHPRERQLRRRFWFPDRAGIHHLYDLQTGESFTARDGTVHWNGFREKWVLIANESVRKGPGKGNVFYAEADSPIGPWAYARKIFTHGNWLQTPYRNPFSFHDVRQHPHLTEDEGKTIYFSGLFRRTNGEQAIARFNNNHLMYRLDLADTRLHLPTPVYLNGNPNDGLSYGTARTRSNDQQDSGLVLFYAYDSDRHGISGSSPRFERLKGDNGRRPVPVWEETRRVNGGSARALTTERSPNVTSDTPVFYAWPSGFRQYPERLTELLEYRHPTDSVLIYVTEGMAGGLENIGWHFQGTVAKVWESPRKNPPTDASARLAAEPTFTGTTTRTSGNGSSGGCLVERIGVSTSGLRLLRTVRDRILPTAIGRWTTARYYTF